MGINSIRWDKWVDCIQQEYLDGQGGLPGLIPSGGSAVKFVSGTEDVLTKARDALLAKAQTAKMLSVVLDPSELNADGKNPDLHKIDKFYFAVTRNIDWRKYAYQQVRSYFEQNGFVVPQTDDFNIASIESSNPTISTQVKKKLMELANTLVTDHGLAYEFRSALASLQQSLVDPQPGQPTLEDSVLMWLRGKTQPGVSTILKKVQIYDRITVRNARYMLMSFCRWLPEVNQEGLVVVLDFRPYEKKKKSQAEINRELLDAYEKYASQETINRIKDKQSQSVFYSDQAYVQMLSLLRHFIDDIDRFERFLLVVLTSPRFYDSIEPRNYNNYDALQTRIGQEVRDIHRPNPVAALVNLEEDRE